MDSFVCLANLVGITTTLLFLLWWAWLGVNKLAANNGSMRNHLFDMFYFSLEFGTSPSAEIGAPPLFTNDILSMISPEKESVPLLKVMI